MRIAIRILAMLMLCSAIVPASVPQETKPQQTKENSKFRPPNDVNDLLDICGEALNQLDTRPTQVASVNVMKFGWCLGWAQALHERIAEVQIYARLEDMNAKKKEGRRVLMKGPIKII